MRKTIRSLLIGILIGAFVFFAANYLLIRRGYSESRKVYSEASEAYTRPAAAPERTAKDSAGESRREEEREEETPPPDCAPIEVDFDELTAVGRDVFGWIYCEGTVINYPVLWGRDNEFYLHQNYLAQADPCGSIFSDGGNIKGVVDSNIILYGHHMQDMSMFATLKYWLEQEYFDEHPYMWLLTPEQDYRLELFSGYVTAADSDTYVIYRGPCPEFDEYLQKAAEQSVVKAAVELEPDAHYMVLSTCAYSFYLARTVLHGKLVPVDSAGGVPFLADADAENTAP